MTRPDAELLAAVAARDRTAFTAFYDRYAARAFGLLLRLLRIRADAEDVLQETFLQVWNRAASFDDRRTSAEAWVLLIARSRAIDRIRRRGQPAPLDGPEPATACVVGERLERDEYAQSVCAALEAIPADQRELIRLAFFDGLTHEEIARRQRLPLGTVKTRIRLGMIRLRDRLTRPALMAHL